MGKRKKPTAQYNIGIMQPDEVNALREVVKDFITKVNAVDNEIDLLKEDRKEIIEEFQEKLDVKTLNAALKVAKIQQSVEHLDTFELFMEVVKDPSI